MYKLKKLSNINQIIKNLDLTNSILVQISMFLNDNDKFSYIDDKDQRIIRKESDQKLVNDLMNVLLDKKILTNKELYEKTNQILKEIKGGNLTLKSKIQNIFKINKDKISNEENRWEELKLKNRSNQNENQIKYKNLDGFVPIYEKPGGIEQGDLNFKLISRPASSKEIEKYSNSWENSKYFNIWMRKQAEHPVEIYMTKLVNLFYQGQENLYKVRPPKQKNQELQQILVKFIPNVRKYDEFENKFKKKINSDEFDQMIEKIDKRGLLKLLIANFLIINLDLNRGNILLRENKNNTELIPIDFSGDINKNSETIESKIFDFISKLQNQNFKEMKEILINDYAIKFSNCFQNSYKINDNKMIKSIIDLDYQLSRISDEEFKEIITGMFSKYDEMKSIFNEHKEIISNDIKNTKKKLESLKQNIENIENIKEIEKINDRLDLLKQVINQIQNKPLNHQNQEESRPQGPKLKLDSLDESKADDLFPEITSD